METYPHAHRRSRAHLDRLNKICDLIALNPGIPTQLLCFLYYETAVLTSSQKKSVTSMLQTLVAENRITHQDHHYFIAET